MKTSVWSLSCQQSVFQRYHSEKHLSRVLPTRWRRKPASIEITSLSPYVFQCCRLWRTKMKMHGRSWQMRTYRLSLDTRLHLSSIFTIRSCSWRISLIRLMGLLQLRYEHDSSTIRARFSYNTLQHDTRFSCARDRFEHSTRISGRRVLHVDWQLNAHRFYFILI